jgi:hypothetical protein
MGRPAQGDRIRIRRARSRIRCRFRDTRSVCRSGMTVVDVIVVIMVAILIGRWSRLMMMGRRLISTTRPGGYAGLPIVVRG